MRLVNLDKIKTMREGDVKGNTVNIKRGLLKSRRNSEGTQQWTAMESTGEFGASMYEFDSGANSIEKQTSGLESYRTVGAKSPMKEKELKEKDRMSKDLPAVAKEELVRYRDALAKKLKEKKESSSKRDRTISKRLLKYKNPLPAKVKGDIARQKSIQGDSDISPII